MVSSNTALERIDPAALPEEQRRALRNLLLLESERRERERLRLTPSYTIPDRNITVRGGAKQLWESTEPRVIIAGPSDCSKTFSSLTLLDWYCWHHPNLLAVIVRKTRADMGSTVLQSWENKIIKMPKEGNTSLDGIKKHGGTHPEFYKYPNGSVVWVVGLDHPGKVLSGEIDLAYVNQAEELNSDDWGTLSTRTSGRAGVLKPGRLIGDANPGPSTHWIKQAEREGTLRFIEATHKDNPELWDEDAQMWTEEGVRRLENLKALPGVLGRRLYKGEWVSAEGTVFEPFTVIDQPYAPIRYYIGGVDWGWTNPGVIQVWGVDGDNRMYRVIEMYETEVPVELQNVESLFKTNKYGYQEIDPERLAQASDCWVKRALDLHYRLSLPDPNSPSGRNYFIRTWQCDPARPEFIAAFQRAGLNAVGANNSILQGIQYVEARQVIQKDGYPRIALLRGSRGRPDPVLVEKHLPTCLEEEVEVYVYPKDPASGKARKNENPVDAFNHGADVLRYDCHYLDGGGGFFFA